MRKLNPAIAAVAIASVFLLSSCSSTPKTAKELACEKAAEAVSSVNELAKATTDGLSPFPKLSLLQGALAGAGASESDLGDWGTLDDFETKFGYCLTPEGAELIGNSRTLEFESFLKSNQGDF